MLHCAVSRNHESLAQRLIDSGADINARTSGGSTPLHIACSGGHTSCARLLVRARAAIEGENDQGESALSLALQAGAHECVLLLFNAGAPLAPLVRDASAELGTVLHAAASRGWAECVDFLLGDASTRAQLDVPNEAGRTALMVACKVGAVDVTSKLLAKMAAISPRDSCGKSALDYARVRVARRLVPATKSSLAEHTLFAICAGALQALSAWQRREPHLPPDDVCSKMRAAARRSIQSDPNCRSDWTMSVRRHLGHRHIARANREFACRGGVGTSSIDKPVHVAVKILSRKENAHVHTSTPERSWTPNPRGRRPSRLGRRACACLSLIAR